MLWGGGIKTLLFIQITAPPPPKFSNFSWIFFSIVLTICCFWNYENLNFNEFLLDGTKKMWNFQNPMPPTKWSWTISTFFWNFCSLILTTLLWGIVENLSLLFLKIFVSKIFKLNSPYCTICGNQALNHLEKERAYARLCMGY